MKIALVAALMAFPAAAQVAPAPATPAPVAAPTPVAIDPATLTRVRLDTAAGPIVIGVDLAHAPVTARNFLKYVEARKLDGVGFYRAMKLRPGLGLVQFGTRNDPKRTLPPIAHEPTTTTGWSHTDGVVSMAMAKPGTAAGDFFIVVGDITSMDAKAGDPGFAAFGRVLEGGDVIRRILDAPTSPTLGEGVMKGQMLSPTIAIRTARRL